jgi:hypothetical protein
VIGETGYSAMSIGECAGRICALTSEALKERRASDATLQSLEPPPSAC